MARDQKDPDGKREGERDRGFFNRVDGDARGALGRLGRDDDERLRGARPGSEPSDPGCSAFAETPDDPLAEGPSPDAVLEALPEMRGRKAPARANEPPARADDEDFVDDFLNDLDDVDRNYSDKEYGEDRAALGEETPADDSAFIGAMRDARANLAREMMSAEGARAIRAKKVAADTPPPGNGAGRLSGLPFGMIALVTLALILIGAGGYGAIQQRGAMRAEIRELHARLASTLTPAEVAAQRERRRQIELENETLRSEREALQVENAALSERLSRLQAPLARPPADNQEAAAAAANAQREAVAREAEPSEAEAQPARRQREESAGAQAAANASAPAGPWFVNFGSYAQREVADRWASRLDVGEGRLVVQRAETSGNPLYRLRVVDLATRDAAEQVAIALEREHALPKLWVGRVRP